jgi:hypothetical protein
LSIWARGLTAPFLDLYILSELNFHLGDPWENGKYLGIKGDRKNTKNITVNYLFRPGKHNKKVNLLISFAECRLSARFLLCMKIEDKVLMYNLFLNRLNRFYILNVTKA